MNRPSEAEIRRAADALRDARPVVLPTDTVYGVAADPRREAAVARLFELKGRPDDKPLPLLVASIADAKTCAAGWPRAAQRLAETFWPGPLTIVVPAAAGLAPSVTAGGETVGLRQPNHPLALALLTAFGAPLACTSANASGRPPARSIADLPPAFFAADVSRLDAGELPPAEASTVLQVSNKNELTVLRPGVVTLDAAREAIGRRDEGETP